MPTDRAFGASLPLVRRPDGVGLKVRLTPRAARPRIGPVAVGDNGAAFLKVSVTAVPEAGKANAQMIGMLAKAWRLPKNAFRLAAGSTSRTTSSGNCRYGASWSSSASDAIAGSSTSMISTLR